MAEGTFASALVLFAHPDDAEFMCGGTVARWARDGCDVHYVVITDGSAGSNEPGVTREELRPVREREQRAAAAVLGVQSVTFLGEVDGMLEVTLDTRRKVCRSAPEARTPAICGRPVKPARSRRGNRWPGLPEMQKATSAYRRGLAGRSQQCYAAGRR